MTRRMLATPRRRTALVFALATVLVIVVLAGGALVLIRDTSAVALQTAEQRAEQRGDLLGRLGPQFPNLASAVAAGRLAAPQRSALDRAVALARREGLLTDLTVWSAGGRRVYSSGDDPARAIPRVLAALGRLRSARAGPARYDTPLAPGGGALPVLVALRGRYGALAGAMEVSLPLTRLAREGARIRGRVLGIVTGGGLALWLLAVPLTLRAARSAARDWVPGRRRTQRALRRGLQTGEIELAYQPQVEPGSGAPVAMEALVRWRHAGRLLAPGAFLDAVEGTPLMATLTEHVLDLALRERRDLAPDGRRLRLSVNLSAQDLGDEELPTRVAAALRRHGVAARDLTLEVTETAVAADEDRARAVLEGLRAVGVEVSVDDFGTGHSSIARLHRLPVEEVKIDRAFVSATDDRSRFYVQAIVGFARALGLRVVAEGVEDAGTLALLAELGCDLAQGYHLSPPLDAAGMRAWLGARAAAAAGEPALAPR